MVCSNLPVTAPCRGLDLLSDKADLQSQIELMPVVAGVGVFAGIALGAAAMAVRGKSAAARFQHVVATQTTKIEQLCVHKQPTRVSETDCCAPASCPHMLS